jgi:RNA polymerase sigma-70 factor (ECF subfamily)
MGEASVLMAGPNGGRLDRSDEELLQDTVGGDLRAFDVIVRRYRDRLLNFVFRYLGDRTTAEDVVQETFLRVFRKSKDYRASARFSTWLFTIAGNLAKSELRRRKRWRFISLGWNEDAEQHIEIPDDRPRPDAFAETEIATESIEKAIKSLSPNQRQVVILSDIQGMAYEEIAQIVGCPVGTVKSRINRGRLRLQDKLERLGYLPDSMDAE